MAAAAKTASDVGSGTAETERPSAAAEGISKADLVDKLVAAAQADIAADVKAGRLTQAQADAISKNLEARITKMVDKRAGY